MNTKDEMLALADQIRTAVDRLGYDLVLREFSPRTEIGIRNFRERSEELAAALRSSPSLPREAIVKIIDPELREAKADGRYSMPDSLWHYREKWALEKADAILQLLTPSPGTADINSGAVSDSDRTTTVPRSINSSSMVARHHDSDTLGDRAPAPAGGEREALEQIIRIDQIEKRGMLDENDSFEVFIVDGPCAKIARAALSNKQEG